MPNGSPQTPRTSRHLLIKRFTQISESHCGPAVIQMLLANCNVEVDQVTITSAGDAVDTIEEDGMRVDQLARAVYALAPHLTFWYKYDSTIDDIEFILKKNYPVGVEWQGLFDSPEEEAEAEETDYGHYSIVSYIDKEKDNLIIVDPYKEYANQDRIVDIPTFKKRWWDYNAYPDPKTGKEKFFKDIKLLFIVTPGEETFPHKLNMKKAPVIYEQLTK